MKQLYFILILLSGFNLFATDITFTRHEVGAFERASDVSIADINHDGYLDIVATAYDEGIAWWENDGQQNFTKHIIADITNHNFARFVVSNRNDGTILDLNNDGFVDLVSAAMTGNRVSLWINDGNGNFTETVVDDQSFGAHTIDISDLDDDGDDDILIAAMGGLTTGANSELAIYRNDGNLQFSKEVLSANTNKATFIHAADLNNNGEKEILFVEYGAGLLGWYKKEDAGYTKVVLNSFSGMHSALARDYDKDGDLDILASAYNGCKFFIWQNDGSGAFTKVWEYQGMGGSCLDMADFDNDGENDLLGVATNSGVSPDLFWFKNNGNSDFTAHPLISNLREVHSSAAADLDGDGDQDIIIAVNASNRLIWWENSLIVGLEEESLDTKIGLLQNYPNPFNPSTQINYSIETSAEITMSIFNIQGELIWKTDIGYQQAGTHNIKWNGKNNSGSSVPSGTYIYQVSFNDHYNTIKQKTAKMLLLK